MNEYTTPPRRALMGRLGILVGGIALLVILAIAVPSMVEVLEANKVMVIQSLSGELNCYTDAGPKPQMLGTVTKYPRRGSVSFDRHVRGADGKIIEDNGKPLQFNDGGKGTLYGSVNWEMPADCKQIIEIHKAFGSVEGIEAQGVNRMVNSAVYLSGPMMSSTESSAEKRGMLVDLINDQAQHGVYQTTTRQVDQPDPITGEKRTVITVEIMRNTNGTPKRQQGSILEQYGIHLQPMAIERLNYSTEVEAQIAERQKATQSVQLSQASARKAQQDAITAEESGKATAAKAKWEQETIKARVVTEAQQSLEVAALAAKEAEQYKRQQVLMGEGDAERRRLVLQADGALAAKLEAYVKVHSVWATNFGQFKGNLVPQVVTNSSGGATGGAVGSTQNMLDLIGIKAAKDLALDLANTGTAATVKK